MQEKLKKLKLIVEKSLFSSVSITPKGYFQASWALMRNARLEQLGVYPGYPAAFRRSLRTRHFVASRLSFRILGQGFPGQGRINAQLRIQKRSRKSKMKTQMIKKDSRTNGK